MTEKNKDDEYRMEMHDLTVLEFVGMACLALLTFPIILTSSAVSKCKSVLKAKKKKD